MTDLRLKRLLWVAYNHGNTKRFYPQYLKIMNTYYNPCLVEWYLGAAFLTEAGVAKMKELMDEQ
jgi:hypothetical protein